MEVKKECLICKNLFIDQTNGKNKKYCSEKCREKGKKINAKVYYDKKFGIKRQKKCLACGKDFYDDSLGNGRKYCCEKCANDAKKQQMKKFRENQKEDKKETKKENKKETPIEHSISGKSIAEVQREARAAGMSYGKYVAMMERNNE